MLVMNKNKLFNDQKIIQLLIIYNDFNHVGPTTTLMLSDSEFQVSTTLVGTEGKLSAPDISFLQVNFTFKKHSGNLLKE
jgi:hypothetical protein